MADVCLVSMPFARVESPSLALGLLKAGLDERHISSDVLYPNLWFAEELGLYKYKVFSEEQAEHFVGEWIFAGSAFPGFDPDYAEYLQRYANCTQDFIDLLGKTRENAKLFIDKVAQNILEIQPRIVSCSSTFHQNCASLALLRRLRDLEPALITVMGGANCEGMMGITIHQAFPWVDFVCSGEGEEIFPTLCQILLKKGRDANPELLPYGVIGSGCPHHPYPGDNAPRASVTDLDQIPIPNFEDYFKTLNNCPKIAPYISPGLFVETTRGCWWGQKQHCTFCGLNGQGMTYRSKSPERVIDEFSELSQKYGLHKFFVVDNILNLSHLQTVLPQLATLSPPYSIFYETKANLKYEQVQQLAAAGVHWLQPGIEGLHDQTLALMRKGTTASINVQLLKWGRELGIQMIWNYLVGLPHERRAWHDQVLEWLPLISHLEPPTEVRTVGFHRFSPYHQKPGEFSLTLQPHKAYSYIYALPPEQIENIAYYFEDVNPTSHRTEKSEATTRPTADHEKIRRYVREWRQSFYLDETPILNIIEDDGQQLTIKDTRACRVQPEICLEGLAYQIYQCCNGVTSINGVSALLLRKYKTQYPLAQIQDAIHELQSLNILLYMNSTILNLATTKLPFQTKTIAEQPGGYIDLQKYIEDAQKRFWEVSSI